jgi:LysM repeat protein
VRFAVPAIALAMLLLFAACGDGDSPFDLDQPTPTVAGSSQTPFPEVTATPAPTACAPTAYAVQDGDTLLAIAIEFDVTVDAIIEASELDEPDFLSIGQELTIPCPPPVTPTPIGTGDEPTDTPAATEAATSEAGDGG